MVDFKNQVLLVFPGQRARFIQKNVLVNLPLSVLQLASYLLERGFDTGIHDTRVDRPEEFRKKAASCLLAGFSCMTGQQIKHALAYARLFKEINPGAAVVFGGIHPSLFPEQTLQHPLVDFVVVGEGEESLFQLADHLRAGG
jgi:anaerobic magnesium-protoporphyrin IX monomethyl ester cyclase